MEEEIKPRILKLRVFEQKLYEVTKISKRKFGVHFIR